jgi:hypothetical protein
MSLVVVIVMLLLGGRRAVRAADIEHLAVEVRHGNEAGTHVEVRGDIPLPASTLRVVLRDLASFPRWFPAISRWTIVTQDDSGAVVHGVQEFPWPLGDRDYVVRYVWREGAGDVFALEARSMTSPSVGELPGVIRLDDVHSVWTVTDRGTSESHVTYTYDGSIGGRVPEWVQRVGWRARAGDVLRNLFREARVRARGDAE